MIILNLNTLFVTCVGDIEQIYFNDGTLSGSGQGKRIFLTIFKIDENSSYPGENLQRITDFR